MAVPANHPALPNLSPVFILEARKELARAQKAEEATLLQQSRKEGLREGDIRTLEHVAKMINVVCMNTDPEREFEAEDFSLTTFDFLRKKDLETYGDLSEKEIPELYDLCNRECNMVVEIIFGLADRGLRVKPSTVEST